MLYQKVLYKTILYTKHYLKILVFMLLIAVLSTNEETEVDRLKIIIWYLLLEFGKPSLGLTVLSPVCFCFLFKISEWCNGRFFTHSPANFLESGNLYEIVLVECLKS